MLPRLRLARAHSSRRPRTELLLVAQVYLPDGTLLIEGYANVPADGPRRFKLPVVGGTGIYADARGYITARSLGAGTTGRTKIDFHVLP